MSKKNYRAGKILYEFVALPRAVLRSDEYVRLPFSAKALMNDLAGQYTGKNNGRLCVAFEVMKHYGWTSKPVLLRAKRALLGCRFAVLTRKGHAPRTAEWLGFTWWPLDYEQSMDVDPRHWPLHNFLTIRKGASGQEATIKINSCGSESEPIPPQKVLPVVLNQNHRGTERGVPWY